MRIAVGLSGGVDSAVAALLLAESGHEVVGLTMRTWDGGFGAAGSPARAKSGCYGPGEEHDVAAAAAVAERLGIAHHDLDLVREYRAEVLEPFRATYACGRTPNPCVGCNQRVKFDAMLLRARAEGLRFDLFATGHYARVESRAGRFLLRRGLDHAKDQSYFLSMLSQRQLSRMALPLGAMTKAAVKAKARQAGWNDLADKPESQDFAEAGSYGALLAPGDARPGPILDLAGRVIGGHEGVAGYTVGQRKRLGLGGGAGPLFVVAIDGPANAVTVGPKAALLARTFTASAVRWAAGEPPASPLRLLVQVRHRHRPAYAVVEPAAGGRDARITFDEPQSALTPGQTAALYEDDAVFGSGVIAEVEKSWQAG